MSGRVTTLDAPPPTVTSQTPPAPPVREHDARRWPRWQMLAAAAYGVAVKRQQLRVLAIANTNVAQAVLIMILILQPMIFLSGAWNPPEAMSPWLRGISLASPLRYFIEFAFGVILKGNTAAVVAHDVVGIAVVGAVLFVFSLIWFDRSLKAAR